MGVAMASGSHVFKILGHPGTAEFRSDSDVEMFSCLHLPPGTDASTRQQIKDGKIREYFRHDLHIIQN